MSRSAHRLYDLMAASASSSASPCRLPFGPALPPSPPFPRLLDPGFQRLIRADLKNWRSFIFILDLGVRKPPCRFFFHSNTYIPHVTHVTSFAFTPNLLVSLSTAICTTLQQAMGAQLYNSRERSAAVPVCNVDRRPWLAKFRYPLDAMWCPFVSFNTDVSMDRCILQRPRHLEPLRLSTSNLVFSSSR